MRGYRLVPNLLTDSGGWWHGAWIQADIHAFRPLSAYLFWLETWLGLKAGFFWVGCLGVLLLLVNSWLAAALTWRFTQSRPATYLAAVLAVALRFHNWSGGTPAYWLVWYPIHQELLMNALMMGAAVSLDVWVEKAQPKYLASAWICFVVGFLTKEHVYIFPAMAFFIAVRRREVTAVGTKRALVQVAMMFLVVAITWVYRAAVVVNPRNPEMRWVYFYKKPWLYLFFPYYPFMLTGQFWFAGLALLLFSSVGAIIRWNRSVWRTWLHKPLMPVAVFLVWSGVVALYCQLAYGSFFEMVWYLFDTANQMIRFQQLLMMLSVLYSLWLVWKYRLKYPTAVAFFLLALSYTPVISYLGWHYTVPAWFMRSAYWAIVGQLAWIDLSPLLLHLLRKVPNRFVLGLVSRWEPATA